MEIRPKSPDELQAQAETFLNIPAEDNEARLTVLKTIRETISGGGKPDISSLDYQKYVAYLRSIGGMRAQEVQERIAHLQDYAKFAGAVAKLKKEIASVENIREIPSCLGRGSNTFAFLILVHGKKYVARLKSFSNQKNLEKYPNFSSGEYYMQMEIGLGVPNLEQVVAFSREDGVTISEYAEGTVGNKLTIQDCEQIPAWQFVDVTKTHLKANELGILIDTKASNYIYNPQTGFTIIDYHTGSERAGQGSMMQVGFFLDFLSGRPNLDFELRTMTEPEYYDQIVRGSHEVVSMLRRYRSAIEQSNIDADEKLVIIEMVDTRIANNLKNAKLYADPQYVQSQITRFIEENTQRAEAAKNLQLDIQVID